MQCPRSRGLPLSRARSEALIALWGRRLRVRQHVRHVRSSRFQVTDERGRPGAGLIGVVVDERTATIYHTRVLTAEGIVHELLHVACPDWSEARVVLETQRRWRESREHTPCARGEREAATRVA